ncbi:hypothetical protein HK098_006528 [Nowakowskiella sp. JEL0407]|nr:hypothetical protein HK098_006528 [Nowakowskiella sp. JEL0407]
MTFTFSNDSSIEIVQDRSLLSKKGVTGSVVWDSAVYFSTILSTISSQESDTPHLWPPKLRKSKCIELGCGTGLLSITLSTLSETPSVLVVTDTQEMINVAYKNFVQNQHSFRESTKLSHIHANGTNTHLFEKENKTAGKKRLLRKQEESDGETNQVILTELLWGDTRSEALMKSEMQQVAGTNTETFELIFATDCIYNEASITPFISTLQGLLASEGVAYVGQELRADEVHYAFVSQLLQRGFVLWRLDSDDGGGVVLLILSARSSFFKNLFGLCQEPTSSQSENKISLPYSSAAIDIILDYIYADAFPTELDCTEKYDFDTLLQAFLAADYLELPFYTELAQNIMKAYTAKYVATTSDEKRTFIENTVDVFKKYETLRPVVDDKSLASIFKTLDVLTLKNSRHKGFSFDRVSKDQLYRILQFSPFAFDSTLSTLPSSQTQSYLHTGSNSKYEMIFKFLLKWLKCHHRFTANSTPSPETSEIATFAFQSIEFSQFSRDFIQHKVDCGLFSDKQMLDIYRLIINQP